MNRIDVCFSKLAASKSAALIPFITAGDPLPEATVAVMHALVGAGADLIELGMPFSDPMADGPVIQHADERTFRERDAGTPVVLMGYLNPIAIHGIERFAGEAREAGVDGVLVVDCPIEEDAFLQPLRDAGLERILLVAPTTSEARLARAIDAAEGYLYYVSFAGITGALKLSVPDVAARVANLRARAGVPVAVGFGIKDGASAKAIAGFCDAVVIGSALVERLADAADVHAACERAQTFLAPIRKALDEGRSLR